MIIVGSLRVELYLSDCQSLKDRRSVLRSLMDRLRNKFHVAVAELSQQPKWQYAEIGIACVSNSEGHVREMLQNILRFIEGNIYGEVIAHDLDVY
jgi:hypothetical protein